MEAARPIRKRHKKTAFERDPTVLQRIEAGLARGLSEGNAALSAGISAQSFSEWKTKALNGDSRYAVVLEMLKRGEARFEDFCLRAIDRAIEEGSWQAAAWKLERRFPERWGRRDHLLTQHSGIVKIEVVFGDDDSNGNQTSDNPVSAACAAA